MKIKSMLTNSVYVFSALLIGIAVCVLVWFSLKEHKNRGIPTHENASREHQPGVPINNKESPAQNPDGNPEEELLTSEQRVARLGKRNFMAMQSEEDLATPYMQKFLKATDPESPALLEYLKDMRENGASFRKWNDFLESQGVPVKREYPEMFRKYFPTGEPKDYDPEMRLKIAELFLAAKPVDLTNPEAAAIQRMEVISEFQRKNKRHRPWVRGRFGDHFDGHSLIEREGVESNPNLVWVADVQRNAASIVAQAEQARGESPESQASASSWDMSSVMEDPAAFPDETSGDRPSMVAPLTDADERPTNPNTGTRAAATPAPDLTDMPSAQSTFPTNADLEASLKSQFSPDRFERAMDTLEQYGPEEGLRRLKENDPEVAKQIEQHRNQESVPRPREVSR